MPRSSFPENSREQRSEAAVTPELLTAEQLEAMWRRVGENLTRALETDPKQEKYLFTGGRVLHIGDNTLSKDAGKPLPPNSQKIWGSKAAKLLWLHVFRTRDLWQEEVAPSTDEASDGTDFTGGRFQVPYGFTLPVELGKHLREDTNGRYNQLPPPVKHVVLGLERKRLDWLVGDGQSFGNHQNPLLVAVRSGAEDSMPGQMETVLNVGINDDSISSLEKRLGERGAWQTYANFCLSFIQATTGARMRYLQELFKQSLGEQPSQTRDNAKDEATTTDNTVTTDNTTTQDDAEYYRQMVEFSRRWLDQTYGLTLPQDPFNQLHQAILAVYKSYDSLDAYAYRCDAMLSHENHTGVSVVEMVYGNMKSQETQVTGEPSPVSGSGQALSHNPITGKRALQVNFSPSEQGFAVVDDQEPTLSYIPDISHLSGRNLKAMKTLRHVVELLVDAHDGAPVDIEFVIQQGELWIVQLRLAKLSPEQEFQFLMSGVPPKSQDYLAQPHPPLGARLLTQLPSQLQTIHIKELYAAQYELNSWIRDHVDPAVIQNIRGTRFYQDQERAALNNIKTRRELEEMGQGEKQKWLPELVGHGVGGGVMAGKLVIIPFDSRPVDSRPVESRPVESRVSESKPDVNHSVIKTQALARAKAWLESGEQVVIMSNFLNPNDLDKLLSGGEQRRQLRGKVGMVTLSGNPGSHAANVARGQGLTSVVGCRPKLDVELTGSPDQGWVMEVDGVKVFDGADVSINAQTGRVYLNTKLEVEELQLSLEQQKFLEHIEAVYGKQAYHWAVIQQNLDSELTAADQRFRDSLTQAKQFSSIKAEAQELMNAVFADISHQHEQDSSSLIRYDPAKCDTEADIEHVKSLLLAGLADGYDMTIRSALTPTGDEKRLGANPWVLIKSSGELDEDRAVIDAFFSGDKSKAPRSKYGTWLDWPGHYTDDGQLQVELHEVLIGYDPPEKLDQDKSHQHFVASMTMDPGAGRVIQMTLRPGTAQMRALEESSKDHQPDQHVSLRIAIDPKRIEDGLTVVGYGPAHHHHQGIVDTANRLFSLDPRQVARADYGGDGAVNGKADIDPAAATLSGDELLLHGLICRQLGHDNHGMLVRLQDVTSLDEVQAVIAQLIEQGKVPLSLEKKLITPLARQLVDDILGMILGEEMRDDLVVGMAVLEKHFETSLTLEFQGRIHDYTDGDTIPGRIVKWLKIYGLKGIEELPYLVERESGGEGAAIPIPTFAQTILVKLLGK